MKWLVRVIAVAVALLLLATIGIAFYPTSSFVPAARDFHDESSRGLADYVGWYELESGSMRLLTWAAEHGLVLYEFGLKRKDLSRLGFHFVSKDVFVSEQEAEERRLEFTRSSDGSVVEARVTAAGDVHTLSPVAGPYETREVRFESGAIELAGLLYLPSTPGPHPAVAFIHGSGSSSRDGFWYLTPADYLARNGVAVLLPDKRGSGKSGGEWHKTSFDDYASDALAAVALLSAETEVDSDRIGLVGFSQGGWIAPLAASRSANVAFVVTVSGSSVSPSEQVKYEVGRDIANAGAPDFAANMLAPLFARRAKMSRKLWWQLNGSFDPIPLWQDWGGPTLMFFGEADQNVDVFRSLAVLQRSGLTRRENFSTQVFPNLGHGLIREDSGWIEPEFLRSMAQFVRDRNEDL